MAINTYKLPSSLPFTYEVNPLAKTAITIAYLVVNTIGSSIALVFININLFRNFR